MANVVFSATRIQNRILTGEIRMPKCRNGSCLSTGDESSVSEGIVDVNVYSQNKVLGPGCRYALVMKNRDRTSDTPQSFEEFPLMSRENSSTDSDDELNDRNHLIGRGRRRTFWSSFFCCCCLFTAMCYKRLEDLFCRVCCGRRSLQPRYIRVGYPSKQKYPSNVVKNQKYNIFTFIPVVLFNQFKFFLNFYFLVMAVSQFIPEIRVGYLSTYWGPLGFVLAITMCREAFDDFCRYRRDKEINSEKYEQVTPAGTRIIKSSKIKVGDLIIVRKDQRIPADMILLRTTEKTGACFIRTDQLDGETDWKLRIALPVTQGLIDDGSIFGLDLTIYAEKPQKSIHTFLGTAKEVQEGGVVHEDALNIENTMWCSTVVASGTSLGLVIYTGRETRAAMNASQARSKVGLLDYEVNNLTKILFCLVIILAFVMVCLKGFAGPWYRHLFRFILLFSYIIPLSLRVTLDLAKFVYAYFVSRDKNIPDTVVRSSTIPEELGRVSFLLSDKTGTLTQNQMIFKKLHLGNVAYTSDTFDEIRSALAVGPFSSELQDGDTGDVISSRYPLVNKIQQAVEAIALCHNVTPVNENGEVEDELGLETSPGTDEKITYQASSPDEVALVTWTGSVGLQLIQRDLHSMQLRLSSGEVRRFTILQLFPFTSESKRMGIILQDEKSKEITFLLKGADSVMGNIVQFNDWLEEECSNLAREGLRTLVVAKKTLTESQYQEFEKQYHQAKISLTERASKMSAVVSRLERDMQLLCVTGVEDSLQKDVRVTLEMLRNAGIKVWMLTGDKLETAICIAKSSGLFSRNQNIHVFNQVTNRADAHAQLNALRRKTDNAMVITGDSLKVCLQDYEEEFAELASGCPSVVCCRCSPEQKAQIVNMLKKYHRPLRVAAIGDGGNDVSMIQAADAGIGIVGKEGMQASLAADFSITQFSHLLRLLLVHGRHCYKRSCALAQFVIHRGLIISTMQAVFSCVFYFVSVSLYPGTLMVLYSTIYTSFPVFSLVMDRDIKDSVALTYPELYKELFKGRSLSYKTFFMWVLASIYQGAAIMYLALVLFDSDFIHIESITFTALILTELIMVALTVHRWHWAMIVAELFSVICYAGSLFVLSGLFEVTTSRDTFDWNKLDFDKKINEEAKMTEEELAFDPTMKKKKKKKAVDLDQNEDAGKQKDSKPEVTESAEQPDVDSGVALEDFGGKKKKKKPKPVEEEKPEAENVPAAGEQGTADALWPDYSYDELLNRVFNIMREKNPDVATGEKKKFKLSPPQVGRAGSKKTAFANFPEICKQLKRTPKHLLAFLLAELGTSGSVDGNNQLIIKGRFQQKHIESVLRKYIKEYVTCHTCHSAETELQKDTRLFFLQCSTCGSRCSVAAIKSGYQAVTTRRAAMKTGTQA